MNVRIFWVHAMKCMCAQTRPRFILSFEGVFGGMEFEPMLTPREKSPPPENVPRGGSNPRRRGQRAQALPAELFRPPGFWLWYCLVHPLSLGMLCWCQVQGIGPTFKLTVNLQNTSLTQASNNLIITFEFDPRLYSFRKKFIQVCVFILCVNTCQYLVDTGSVSASTFSQIPEEKAQCVKCMCWSTLIVL